MEQPQTIREAVGIFDDYDQLEKAINSLQIHGFGRHQISVLGNESALEERFGTSHVKTEMLEDHPSAPRSPDIKKEELGIAQSALISGGILGGVVTAILATGGVAAPGILLAALAGGTGGTAVGAILAKLLGDQYAEFFQKQIDEGGLLLWVTTPTHEMESKATFVLEEHGAKYVHIHDIQILDHPEASHISDSPQTFGKAFVILDEISHSHEPVLENDWLIQSKLGRVLELLKDAATSSARVSANQATHIASAIEETTEYAQDMAEEEQRMISESQMIGTGIAERNAQRYFALAKDLKQFGNRYRQTVLHQAKAA